MRHTRAVSLAVSLVGVAPHQITAGAAAKAIVVEGVIMAPLERPRSTPRHTFPRPVTASTKASSQEICSSQQQATALVPTYGTIVRTVARTSEFSAKEMVVAEVEPSQSKLSIVAPTAAVEDEPSTFPPKLLLLLLIQTLVSSLSSIRLLHHMTMRMQCPGQRRSSLLKSAIADSELAGAPV